MELINEKKGGVIHIKVVGEMSVDEARRFADELMNNIDKSDPQLEIDFSGCDFMCSNGLGALAAALMVARSRGGDLKLSAVSNNVNKLLDITTLGTIIKMK